MAQLSKAKIFLLVLISFIVGIAFAGFISLGGLLLYYLTLVVVLLIFLGSDRTIKLFGLLIFFFILGILRYQLSEPKTTADKIYFYNGQKITFIGRVAAEPDQRRDKVYLTVLAQRLNKRLVTGNVLVSAPLYSQYQYGQWLEIQCRLNEPMSAGRFNYHEYLARYDIYSICGYPKIKILLEQPKQNLVDKIHGKILALKSKFENLISQNFTEPQGALLSALTLGLQKEIPPPVQNWFQRTGTWHIVSISGMHVAIMIQLIEALILGIFGLSRQRAFYLSLLFITIFIILIGAPPAAVRAAIMGLAVLYAKKIGRPTKAINLIVLTAALMLLNNPRLLKADVGFQLSFLAILGMGYFGNYFYQIFQKLPEWRYLPLRYSLSTTLSAQVFTLPLILYYFGNLSLIAPLANLLVLQVLSVLMIFAFLFFIIGACWVFIAKIFVFPIWLLLTYTIVVIKLLSNIPYLSFNVGQIHWLIVLILYGLIVFWVPKMKKRIAAVL